MARDDTYTIDPPVGPYSPLSEMLAWRAELKQMPDSPAKDDAMAEIDRWIERAEAADGGS